MSVSAKQDLAMILPLPVLGGSGESAVRFINLEAYPNFFYDLESGFPAPPSVEAPASTEKQAAGAHAKLEVFEVGSFEASFVPTLADFSRLDERYRLPSGTWEKLPSYRHYGFAVFKLKPGAQKVHPMALSFPRAKLSSLFFPTVHIHDGRVHSRAKFDHALYCQITENDNANLTDWRESPLLAKQFVKVAETKNIVQPEQHCFRKEMRGLLDNRDVWL
jgi:hypothetical protein